MKKVVLVRSRATDAAVFKNAESLARGGFDVHLLLWDRQHNLRDEKDAGYRVHRFAMKAPYDRMTIIFYHPFWWLYELYFLLVSRPDIIHACDLDTLLPAVLVKLLLRNKLFYTIYDFYADNFSDRGSSLVRLLKQSLSSLEKFLIGFADVLFLVDECRLEEVKGARIKKVVYLYNSPADFSCPAEERSQHDGLVVLYVGLINPTRGVEHMVKAVEAVDGIRMIIAGPDSANNLKLDVPVNADKIRFIGYLPTYEDVLRKTFEADLLFRFEDPELSSSKYASPNKLYEAMMCGKPFLVNEGIGSSRIVAGTQCGVIVPYGDVEAIKKALARLRDDRELRMRLGSNGRKAYEEKYSWAIMEKRLLDIYKTGQV
jgi:glycosyltransferase involved in cell wall biosynthesis